MLLSLANDVITLESQWKLRLKYVFFENLLDFKAFKLQFTHCDNDKVIRIYHRLKTTAGKQRLLHYFVSPIRIDMANYNLIAI